MNTHNEALAQGSEECKQERKTVYITRNALFRPLTMILCNSIIQADESFIEDNYSLFYRNCNECGGSGEISENNTDQCPECYGEGQHESEVYQYFLVSVNEWDIERLKEYGVDLGYSKLLDLHVMPIYDYGTGWNAFSYSKEVDADYQLGYDETLSRTTIY